MQNMPVLCRSHPFRWGSTRHRFVPRRKAGKMSPSLNQELRTSSFRQANFRPVAGFRSRLVGKPAGHCGDWKAPPCSIVIGSVFPLRSSISNSGASRGETPLGPVRSMLSSSQRMAVRVHRRETLGWPFLLSLALHLTLCLSLLLIPPTQPPTDASGPLSVELIVVEGPA